MANQWILLQQTKKFEFNVVMNKLSTSLEVRGTHGE